MSKIKKTNLTPNNVHWMDYRKSKNLPINDSSNCIKISGDNLRKLRAAVRRQGGKLAIDS